MDWIYDKMPEFTKELPTASGPVGYSDACEVFLTDQTIAKAVYDGIWTDAETYEKLDVQAWRPI